MSKCLSHPTEPDCFVLVGFAAADFTWKEGVCATSKCISSCEALMSHLVLVSSVCGSSTIHQSMLASATSHALMPALCNPPSRKQPLG